MTAMRWCVLRLVLLAMAVSSGRGAETLGQVEAVRIDVRWQGLDARYRQRYRIRRTAEGYRRKRDRVEAEAVRSLVASLSRPALPMPNAENLGLSEEWLGNFDASEISEWIGTPLSTPSPRPISEETLRCVLRDPSAIDQILRFGFGGIHLDNEPSVRVEVRFGDGRREVVASYSAHPFMIPWRRRNDDVATYDTAIGRAVAALLPPDALNWTQLAGEDWREAFFRDAVLLATEGGLVGEARECQGSR